MAAADLARKAARVADGPAHSRAARKHREAADCALDIGVLDRRDDDRERGEHVIEHEGFAQNLEAAADRGRVAHVEQAHVAAGVRGARHRIGAGAIEVAGRVCDLEVGRLGHARVA